jgi:hypothetical protein
MTTITWTSGTSGLWTTASNGSPAQVPGAGDDVLVTQPGSYTISGVPIAFINSLTLADADAVISVGSLMNVGNLAITAGTLELSGMLSVNGFENTGTILNAGNLSLGGTMTASSLERIGGSGVLDVVGTVLNSGGTLDGAQLASQNTAGFGTILGGTVVNLTRLGFTATLDAVTWQGTLQAGPNLQVADGLTMTGINGTGPGTIVPLFPGVAFTLEATNDQTFDNAVVLGAATITADSGGSIPNTASLTVAGDTVINHGTILDASQQSLFANISQDGSISFQSTDFENYGTIDAIDQSTPEQQLPPPFVYSAGVMTTSITGEAFVNHVGGSIEIGQSAGVAIMTVAATTAFTNDGTLLTMDATPTSIEGGTIDIAAALNGNGTVEAAGGGVVKVEGAAAGTQNIDFTGTGELMLNQPAAVASTINGFAVGDTIDLGVAANAVSYTSGDLRMQIVGGSTFDLAVTGAFHLSDFVITTHASSTDIQLALACFAAGTRLATARGTVAVEALCEGDMMLLADRDGSLPVVWIGHRKIECDRHPAPRAVWPVRIAAGAFARGVPKRDVYLSPDHAVFVRGVLIPVKYLVNGTTIAQMRVDRVHYWHVELPRHAVLLADGLSVESLLPGDRSAFANSDGAVALHYHWAREGLGCAPLIVSGPHVDATHMALQARASAVRRPPSTSFNRAKAR